MRIVLASLTAAALLVSAGAAQAQSSAAVTADRSFVGGDTDRNGSVSYAEFNLLFPEYTEQQFMRADSNGDGVLSSDEFSELQLATGSIAPAPLPAPANPVIPGESLTYSAPQ